MISKTENTKTFFFFFFFFCRLPDIKVRLKEESDNDQYRLTLRSAELCLIMYNGVSQYKVKPVFQLRNSNINPLNTKRRLL